MIDVAGRFMQELVLPGERLLRPLLFLLEKSKGHFALSAGKKNKVLTRWERGHQAAAWLLVCAAASSP